MRNIPRCLLSAILLLAGAAPAEEALDRVNRLRTQAGLPALQPVPALAAAAARHAAYLDRHHEPGEQPQGLSMHTEQPDAPGFSGATPQDRALAAGYPHREVLENLSMGYADTQRALDGLMAAIYHRLTFLDLASDQFGSAVGKDSQVFLLGRSDIGALCAAPPEAARFRPPVDCLGSRMTRAHYLALCAALPDEALFAPPHPIGCTNGVRLEAAFMQALCERPPPAARFRGHGRYYLACENGTKVDADWFDSLCERRPAGAVYAASGHYYEICEDERRVKAEWLEAHCAALPDGALYRDSGRYRRPCADEVDVRVEYLDALDAARRGPLPEVVLWPPPDAAGVPPAFFVEEPDPLPDLEVSGYPLSIQFNPARVERVDLLDFRLFRLEGDRRVPLQQVRLLDQASDPNQRLTAYEFALFPLRRLDWGAHYLAEVEALLDGQPRRFAWSFATRGHDTPLLTVAGDEQRFIVQTDVDYLLYVPPREDRPYTVLSTRTEHLRGNRVILAPVDPNTLRVRVQAIRCDRIRLDFDDGRRVELVPADCGG